MDYPKDKTFHGIRDDRPIDKECGNEKFTDLDHLQKKAGDTKEVNEVSNWSEGRLSDGPDERTALEKVGDAIKGAAVSTKESIVSAAESTKETFAKIGK